jgi:hypothetical protein
VLVWRRRKAATAAQPAQADDEDDADEDDELAAEATESAEEGRFTEADMALLKLVHGLGGAEGTSMNNLRSIFEFVDSDRVTVDGLSLRSPADIESLKAKLVASDGWVTVPAAESNDPARLKDDPDFVIGYLPLKRAVTTLLRRHERRRQAGTADPVAWEAKPVFDEEPGAGKQRVFWEPETGLHWEQLEELARKEFARDEVCLLQLIVYSDGTLVTDKKKGWPVILSLANFPLAYRRSGGWVVVGWIPELPEIADWTDEQRRRRHERLFHAALAACVADAKAPTGEPVLLWFPTPGRPGHPSTLCVATIFACPVDIPEACLVRASREHPINVTKLARLDLSSIPSRRTDVEAFC